MVLKFFLYIHFSFLIVVQKILGYFSTEFLQQFFFGKFSLDNRARDLLSGQLVICENVADDHMFTNFGKSPCHMVKL